MVVPTTSQVWKLKHAPAEDIPKDTFELVNENLPELTNGEVILQTVYLSNDPSQRTHIQKDLDADRHYAPVVREGMTMSAYGIGKVVASRAPEWTVGALAIANMGWRQYSVLKSTQIRPVPKISGHPPTISLGALGATGLTAWFGLYNVCKTKPEHTVVISGAAGATGSAAVQIAKKIIGCKRVIGIAGGPDKCKWVKSLGADVCLDYRLPSFEADLIAATDGFVDVYQDLVGGPILNLMFARMKRGGKIAAVGSISAYNDRSKNVYPNWMEVVSNRISVEGFIVLDFMSEWESATRALGQAVVDGKYSVSGMEEVHKVAFEQVPNVWEGLFTGVNKGKLITEISI